MMRMTLRGMATRRTRTLLTALAIVLGVAMISGALTVSDTMRRAAESLTSSSYGGTDAVVDARTAFAVSPGIDNAAPPRCLPHCSPGCAPWRRWASRSAT